MKLLKPTIQPDAEQAEQPVPSPTSPGVQTKRFEILNKTPRRIAIQSVEEDNNQYLIISPFSTKVLSEDAIQGYDYKRWEQEDLINVKEIVEKRDDSNDSLSYGLGCGVWLVIYLAAALLIPFLRNNSVTWILFAILLGFAFVLVFANTGGARNIGDLFKFLFQTALKAVNMTLFLSVVFGLGGGLFYLFSGGKELASSHNFTLEGLGRVIQYLFLTIATLLPALMYFLFNRRQRGKVQENFIREVLRLDPGVRTITEAESKYLPLVQETFGTTHTSAFLFSSGLPILLCTLLILMGWLLVLQPFGASIPIDIQRLENLLLPRSNAVTFAFLGTYFFAINLVFRRYVRADLTPKTYTHIILRLFLAIILAWTLSALPIFAMESSSTETPETQIVSTEVPVEQPAIELNAGEAITDTQATGAEFPSDAGETGEAAQKDAASGSTQPVAFSTGLLYLLAFFIGIFPETGMTVIRDLTRNPLFIKMFPRLEEEHSLTKLDGINLYDRSRFMEEGIENIENLAHHNLIGLMLSTRISTNRLVDLFDQAILYLHLGLDPGEVADARKQLRAYGIRTATDLEAAYLAAEKRSQEEIQNFKSILDNKDSQPAPLSRVQIIIDTLRDDDWMTYLRNWRELSQRSTETLTLEGVTLVPLGADVQQAMSMAY